MATSDNEARRPGTPSILTDPEGYMRSFEERMKKLTERAHQAQSTMQQLSARVESEDGEVAVTVASGGALSGLELAPSSRHMSSQALAALIVDTYHQAAAESSQRSMEALTELLGDDPSTVEALRRSVRNGLEDR